MKRLTLAVLVLLAVVASSFAFSVGWHNARPITNPSTDNFIQYPSLSALDGYPFTGTVEFAGVLPAGQWRYRGSAINGINWPVVRGTGIIAAPSSNGIRFTDVVEAPNSVVHATVSHALNVGQYVDYAQSTDGGQNWGWWATFFNPPPGINPPSNPALAIDPSNPNNVYWVCDADDNLPNGYRQVYCRYSTNGGISWSSVIKLTGIGNFSTSAGDPSVTVGYVNGAWRVYVIYEGNPQPGVMAVFVQTWVSGNQPPGVETILQQGGTYAYRPHIAANSRGKVYATFTYNSGSPDASLIRTMSVDPLGPVYRVSQETIPPGTTQTLPRIAVDNFAPDSVHVVWQDDRNDPNHYYTDIYYNCSTPDEQHWLNPDDRISIGNAGTYSWGSPSIAVNRIYAAGYPYRHVVWIGPYNPPGNTLPHIWYRKKAETTAPGAPANLSAVIKCYLQPFAYLSWTAPSDPDVACYSIYRSPDGKTNWTKRDSCITGTSYSDNQGISCAPGPYYKVTAVDYAENEGPASNVVQALPGPVGGALSEVLTGYPQPDPKTIQRSAYVSWSSDSLRRADLHPNRLIYRFSGLDTSRSYFLSLIYSRLPSDTSERIVSADVNGIPLHSDLAAPASPSVYAFGVPKQAYQDGNLVLNLNKVAGPNVAVGRIALWMLPKGWGGGGPQSYGGPVRVPSQTSLGPSVPNPTSSGASWAFSLSRSGPVSLKLYDASGRLVKALVDGQNSAGSYTVTWDGKIGSGQNAPSGVYFLRMQAGEYSATRSVTLVR